MAVAKAEIFDFSLLADLTPSDFYLKVDPSCVVELYDINRDVSGGGGGGGLRLSSKTVLQSFDGFSASKSKLAKTMLENKV